MKREDIKKRLPDISDENLEWLLGENGKDVAASIKKAEDLTAERDGLKEQLAAAQKTLDGFKGKTPEDIEKDIAQYKQQAEDAEKGFRAQMLARDQDDWLKARLDEYGVTSPYARRQLAADVKDEKSGLKWKDKAFFGFDEFMAAAKKNDPGLYQTAEEKKQAEADAAAAAHQPAFVRPTGQNTSAEHKYTPPMLF